MIQGWYYSKGGLKPVQEEDQIRACLKDQQGVLWVDFHNATAAEWILLDEVFHFHPLAIGDSMNVQHSPKISLFGDCLFMVVYALNMKNRKPVTTELDLFLGQNYVVTSHKGEVPSLQRARDTGEKIFESGAAFLLHYIIDTLVEDYLPVVEKLNDQLDKIEQSVSHKSTMELFHEIFGVKKEIIHLRTVIGPMRDTINKLIRDDIPLITPQVRMYFRDTFEQMFRISMMLDTYKDLATSAQELQVSLMTNKNNEIMKTLTIITTIILPMTLVTGIYGMNFKNMPELDWKYGYFLVIGLMVAVATASVYFLKKKKWF